MTEEEAIALQATVDEILVLAVEKRSEIGGAVNWGDLGALQVCGQGAGTARTRRDRGQNGMVIRLSGAALRPPAQ
jgi:hypothetical protein